MLIVFIVFTLQSIDGKQNLIEASGEHILNDYTISYKWQVLTGYLISKASLFIGEILLIKTLENERISYSRGANLVRDTQLKCDGQKSLLCKISLLEYLN